MLRLFGENCNTWMHDEVILDDVFEMGDCALKIFYVVKRKKSTSKKEPFLDVLRCDALGKAHTCMHNKVISNLNSPELVEDHKISQPFFAVLCLLKVIQICNNIINNI